MPKPNEYSNPLLGAKLTRRRSLPVEAKPPATLNINVGSFRLSKGARTKLTKLRGVKDGYRLDAVIPGKQLGRRSVYETIPVEGLKRTNIRANMLDNSFEGLRHPWTEVKFVPPKVKLRTNERSRPPADFKLPKDVDLPCNVFPRRSRGAQSVVSIPR